MADSPILRSAEDQDEATHCFDNWPLGSGQMDAPVNEWMRMVNENETSLAYNGEGEIRLLRVAYSCRIAPKGVEGLTAAASVLSRPAEEFDNDPTVESMWAIKAFEHAEVYFNIICSVDPQHLRLTPHDDDIYKVFRETFPDLKVAKLSEEDLKSAEAKQLWRGFCERFKETVEDFSFGTLLRLVASGEYSEENSILVTRVQFLAVELARCREGHNACVRVLYPRVSATAAAAN